MSVEAYPLQWPRHVARLPDHRRKIGRFARDGHWITMNGAISRLQRELNMIGAQNATLSTNVPVRLDGLPRSGQRRPDDPGAAVYFSLKGKPICLPCDRYTDVEQNVAAIAAHIEATRAIERHGVAQDISQVFEGFSALPPPMEPGAVDWRAIFGFPADTPTFEPGLEQEVRLRYKALVRTRHPAAGGSDKALTELNMARDAALKEFRA